jgi:hypothetical protein
MPVKRGSSGSTALPHIRSAATQRSSRLGTMVSPPVREESWMPGTTPPSCALEPVGGQHRPQDLRAAEPGAKPVVRLRRPGFGPVAGSRGKAAARAHQMTSGRLPLSKG